jgi:hypothetical protein
MSNNANFKPSEIINELTQTSIFYIYLFNTKKPEKYVLLDNADNVMDNLSVVAYHVRKFIFGL